MIVDNSKVLTVGKSKTLSHFQRDIVHFFSTRKGGVSRNEYGTLNIGLNQADLSTNVFENRSRLAQSVGIDVNSFVFARQVHGTKVVRVYESDRGRGLCSRATAFPFTDGMVTNSPNTCLVTLAADCVPILFFDPVKKAIGVAHAGWKGTVLKMPRFVIQSMICEFESNPADIIVALGPSAGPCCYEIGQEVIDEIVAAFGKPNGILQSTGNPQKAIFNMWEANRKTLIDSGINVDNIDIFNQCTICNNHTFFSARKGDLGRFGAGIMLV